MNPRTRALVLVGLAYLGFISIGLPDGLLSVAWPSMRASFSLNIDALGGVLIPFTLGYLVSSFLSGRLLARMNVGLLLAASCGMTGLSLAGYAAAPLWIVVGACAVLAGLGAGAIDAGLNTYAATHFSARTMNWLHACYGIGAASGPALMTAVLMSNHSWRFGYAIASLVQIGLAICFAWTHARWTDGAATESGPGTSYSTTLRRGAVWLGMLLFFVYTGVEAAAGVWLYSLLTEARAIAPATAGTLVSVYWGALAAGRVIAGTLAASIPVRLLLRFSMIGLVAGAALIWLRPSDAVSFFGVAVLGLCAAPVFPLLIKDTPARVGEAHVANTIGFQIAAAVLGQSLLPSLAGVLAKWHGLEITGAFLTAGAAVVLGLYEVSRTEDRRMPYALH